MANWTDIFRLALFLLVGMGYFVLLFRRVLIITLKVLKKLAVVPNNERTINVRTTKEQLQYGIVVCMPYSSTLDECCSLKPNCCLKS